MKKFTHFSFSFLLTALLCVAGINHAWAYEYNCAVTAVSVAHDYEASEFTLTISITGKNTAEYSKTTTYKSTLTLRLISSDNTLEGSYSVDSETDSGPAAAGSAFFAPQVMIHRCQGFSHRYVRAAAKRNDRPRASAVRKICILVPAAATSAPLWNPRLMRSRTISR